jgi:CTP-dependent riboflavin kinase
VANRKIKGAIIIPLVPDYPHAQLEIISSEHIKESLSLKDGDIVDLEVRL